MFSKDTLLALLMRANHNNGRTVRHKLSKTLQQYLCKNVCEALNHLHSVN